MTLWFFTEKILGQVSLRHQKKTYLKDTHPQAPSHVSFSAVLDSSTQIHQYLSENLTEEGGKPFSERELIEDVIGTNIPEGLLYYEIG